MTLDEFLGALAGTPRDWRLTPEGAIRIDRSDHFYYHCPLTAVSPVTHSIYSWAEAAADLQLDLMLATNIVEAADYGAYPALRTALLRACGLAEA